MGLEIGVQRTADSVWAGQRDTARAEEVQLRKPSHEHVVFIASRCSQRRRRDP